MGTGTLYDLDVIDSLGSAMLLSDKLIFLGKAFCLLNYLCHYLFDAFLFWADSNVPKW